VRGESATRCQNALGQQTDTARQTEQEKTKPRRTSSEVQESRRTIWWGYKGAQLDSKPKERAKTLFGVPILRFDDSALRSADGGVSAVFGSQLGKDVSDLTLHGIFTH
jgi:hypothetical protein